MKPCVGNANIVAMAPRPDDPDGAEQLVERYAERVYQLALRIAGIEDDADDVMPSLAADGHFQLMGDWSARFDEPAVQGELGVIVAAAIDALPADYRTALILNDVGRTKAGHRRHPRGRRPDREFARAPRSAVRAQAAVRVLRVRQVGPAQSRESVAGHAASQG